MIDLEAFEPSLDRALRIDVRMNAALKDSLAHIAEATTEALPGIQGLLEPLIRRIESGDRMQPATFGLYFHLAELLFDGDLAGATAVATELAAMPPALRPRPVRLRGQDDAARLESVLARRMGQSFESYAPIPLATGDMFRNLLDEGFGLLAAGVPDLHAEIETILSEILLAQAPDGAVMEFDGASHYQFWGLLILNPKHHRTPLAVAEVLAHEAGHSLLFGLTIDEPLVLNADEELFPSPLRADPRPMDGIYHATFVSARMAYAMERLADSGLLSPADRDQAWREAAKDRSNFAAGHAVVRAHGRLSETGQKIMMNAAAWMAISN
jgi:HEXXH motif-containing protein